MYWMHPKPECCKMGTLLKLIMRDRCCTGLTSLEPRTGFQLESILECNAKAFLQWVKISDNHLVRAAVAESRE